MNATILSANRGKNRENFKWTNCSFRSSLKVSRTIAISTSTFTSFCLTWINRTFPLSLPRSSFLFALEDLERDRNRELCVEMKVSPSTWLPVRKNQFRKHLHERDGDGERESGDQAIESSFIIAKQAVARLVVCFANRQCSCVWNIHAPSPGNSRRNDGNIDPPRHSWRKTNKIIFPLFTCCTHRQ